jgi:multiple sugar transport system substrate-binding protein
VRTGRIVAVAATAVLAISGVAACSPSSSTTDNSAAQDNSVTAAAAHEISKPVTLKLYTAYQDAELKALTAEMAKFHAKNPKITVQIVSQGDNNDKAIVAAIKANKSPDVAFSSSADSLGSYCSTGNFEDLKPYLKRDNIKLEDLIPSASLNSYTKYKDDRCALPAEADVYGLYYNKDLLKAAGYDGPPKTTKELLEMTKKLTKVQNGTITQLGFDPFWGSYQFVPAHTAPSWGAKWTDAKGNSNFAGDPNWKKMAEWQKAEVDAVGLKALQRWVSPTLSSNANSNEWGPDHFFEKGQLAMMLDGEWRTQMIKNDGVKLNYGTAPFPVDESQPDLLGAGYVTGNIVGVPKGISDPDKKEAAWQVVKYLSLDPDFEASFAEAIHNVPTLKGALAQTALKDDPNFKTFLDIYQNPKSTSSPINSAGTANQDLLAQFLDKTQAGTAGDVDAGLTATDKAVNAQLAQTGDGGAP